MKVSLIDFTGACYIAPASYAAAILAFTKNTRLEMGPGGFQEFLSKSYDELMAELDYMANTIPSSWEFVDYTFMIEGVTRAFTHQLVRTRTASYAQQTHRMLDVSEGFNYATGPTIEKDAWRAASYREMMKRIAQEYSYQVEDGAAVEDARGILPTNILTNICMKCNMRTFVDLVRKRSSARVQDEYRSVVEAMKHEVRLVHPWIDKFIDRDFDRAASDLRSEISALSDKAHATRLQKLLDQMVTLS